MNIGEKIRKAQDRQGVSSVELASRIGVRPQQLYRWRYSEDIRASRLIQICKALDVDIRDFAD